MITFDSHLKEKLKRKRFKKMHEEAKELLTPIYGSFTEGFDTPDLNRAKSLLAEFAT